MFTNILYKNKYIDQKSLDKINFMKAFWIFTIFSIVGFIFENIWCYINNGFFESRKGLVIGPFSQVYGIGALLLILVLKKIKKSNVLQLFICSAFLGGVAEFICSYFQEILFSSVSWEYSDSIINLYGRTNLKYCFIWGILGCLLMNFLYPLSCIFINKIELSFSKYFGYAMVIFLSINILLSISALLRQNERQNNEPAYNCLDEFLDIHYSDSILQDIYPNMKRL